MKKLLLLLLLSAAIYAKGAPTVSIIIPCHVTHIKKLAPLLGTYTKQTDIPNEIVISASSLDAESIRYLNDLKKKPWPFELIILTSYDRQFAGQNRNLACERSTGELLILQDADDIPHPQRVEIIKHLYNKYNFDHLMHLYFQSRLSQEVFNQRTHATQYPLQKLNVHRMKYYDDIYDGDYIFKRRVYPVNGCPAFPRRVFEQVKYSEELIIGEDEDFNRTVYHLFDRKFIVLAKLYYYYPLESTHL